jgi:outer membrane protein assembly factor BamB
MRSRTLLGFFGVFLLWVDTAFSADEPRPAPPAPGKAGGPVNVMWRFDGAGRFPNIKPPTEWGKDKNILWKTTVDVGGYSSPIVVGDRVFVTAEMGSLICLSLADGKVLWSKDLFSRDSKDMPADLSKKLLRGSGKESKESTPTPASNGELVFYINATGLCACYDLQGNQKWIRIVETAEDEEHFSSSPVFVADRIILTWGCLLALSAKDGSLLWKAPAVQPTHGTPAVAKIGGEEVVVTPTGDIVKLTDGEVLCSKLFQSTYTTPLIEGNILYVVDGTALALELPAKPAKGMRLKTRWTAELDGTFMASPVYRDGLLYAIENEKCRLNVLDAKTGKVLTSSQAVDEGTKKEKTVTGTRIEGLKPVNYAYASPAAADKHLFFFDDAGNAAVLELGSGNKPVRVNKLEDRCVGTPFFVRDRIIVRGNKSVYCIGGK